jgi:uncharacterized protein (UPF0264 family)
MSGMNGMKILVSVRNVAEALLAAQAGVHFIDLKEPSNGALGGLPTPLIAEVVGLLRRAAPQALISATIGDWPAEALDAIAAQVLAVAACGVDHVKVGVVPGLAASALLERLALLRAQGLPVVPVLIADAGVPEALVAQALRGGFEALMLDTANKRAGSLFDVTTPATLASFVRQVQASGTLAGLAGALRLAQLDDLADLAPDFVGFRSAVCVGERTAALDPQRLQQLLQQSLACPLP